jgi:hypothetical protein
MIASAYDAIHNGDQVGVRDALGNHALGPATVTKFQITVGAFGTFIPIAQRNRADTWVALNGVKLTEHQPPIGF